MNSHQPVLLNQVIQLLAPHQGECYLDGTAGYGGHAAAIAEAIGSSGRLILIDRDIRAVQALSQRFGDGAEVIHGAFSSVAQQLLDDGTLADMILLDLGVSSPQIDTASRGFSFRTDAPLDMRMDQTDGQTAADIVNRLSEPRLVQILRDFGEEPNARAVARGIIAGRPFTTTGQLATVIRRFAAPTRDIDAATRSFQALRIEVNDELGQLRATLPVMVSLLAPGGRIAVISFHSLEDRIVKQFFHTESSDCICPPKQPICTCGHTASVKLLTHGPVTADSSELTFNPRARSAKLRAAEKLNQNKRRD